MNEREKMESFLKVLPLEKNASLENMRLKINELVEAYDALVDRYRRHYHETLDTHYNTSSPYEYNG